MHINNQHYRTIWPDPRCKYVEVINQAVLPFQFEVVKVKSLEAMVHIIQTMQVRGAPLIGAAGAYGVALAMLHDDSDDYLNAAVKALID